MSKQSLNNKNGVSERKKYWNNGSNEKLPHKNVKNSMSGEQSLQIRYVKSKESIRFLIYQQSS